MKTNITLKIKADLLRVCDRKGYHLAHKRALARLRKGFDLRWTPASSRDELHER